MRSRLMDGLYNGIEEEVKVVILDQDRIEDYNVMPVSFDPGLATMSREDFDGIRNGSSGDSNSSSPVTGIDPQDFPGRGIRKRKRCRETGVNLLRSPQTGYARFFTENKDRVKQKHPDMSHVDLTRLLASMWNSLPPQEKQHFLDEAERDKARYMKELGSLQYSEAAELTRPCSADETAAATSVSGKVKLAEEGGGVQDLYCKPCNSKFTTIHNMKEHLCGRRHLLMVAEQALNKPKSDTGQLTAPTALHHNATLTPTTLTHAVTPTSTPVPAPSTTPSISGVGGGGSVGICGGGGSIGVSNQVAAVSVTVSSSGGAIGERGALRPRLESSYVLRTSSDETVQVFSDDFLAFHQSREAELTRLRNVEAEALERTASLNREIESIRAAVYQLQRDKARELSEINSLKEQLSNLRRAVQVHDPINDHAAGGAAKHGTDKDLSVKVKKCLSDIE